MSTLWILGEARSGKSELGEEIFHCLPGRKVYIGTLPRTPANADQIRKHEERRPRDWELVEVTDDLAVATRVIERCGPEGAAVLLDGFGVYVQECARRWEGEHPHLTIEAEAPFVDATCRAYTALASRCGYLIVVDHISANAPTPLDYVHDGMRWRVREAITRCRTGADCVIYHDRANVTHTDSGFVEGVAKLLVARTA